MGNPAETVVYYGSKKPRVMAAAQEVANSLTGAVIMAYDPSQSRAGSEVTVVTGSILTVNAPPAGSGVGAPTTTTSIPVGNGEFASPTPRIESLAPWDPRSCTPSGGEGP